MTEAKPYITESTLEFNAEERRIINHTISRCSGRKDETRILLNP